MLHVPTTLGPLRSNPTTLGEAFSLARFEDERSTTSIAKPNDLNTGIHVQDIEEMIRHKPNKVEVVKTSRVATFEEHEHQENQDNLNEISEEKDDAKPPISTNTFRNNGGDDSQTSGLKIPTKDVVDNGNGSTLTFLVGYGSPRALQLWEKVGIEDVLGLLDIGVNKILLNQMRVSEDAEDTLCNLLQIGRVAKYQNEFEMLINRVTGISESLLKTFYISGLKPPLQCALLRSNTTTLGEAFSLTRATKARFNDLQLGTVESNPTTWEKPSP
ncbi:hypothetical protein Tco_0757683 [Tanacetum coccineum]